MKLVFVTLMGCVLAAGTSLAEERHGTPAPATDGHAIASPTDAAGGHQIDSPSASRGSEQPLPDAREKPDVEGHHDSASPPPAGGAPPDHGPRQPTGPDSHGDTPMPANTIDTGITVNQGRPVENGKKGPLFKQQGPLGKASRVTPQTKAHVPRPIPPSGGVHGTERNAIGVAHPEVNASSHRAGVPPAASGPGVEVKSAVGATKSSTGVPGIGPRSLGTTGGGGASVGPHQPNGTSGAGLAARTNAGGINGTGMGKPALRPGQIGGAAQSRVGLDGSTVRPKRP